MTKIFIPTRIGDEIRLVEEIPFYDKPNIGHYPCTKMGADEYAEDMKAYELKTANRTRYATLPSDSIYWTSMIGKEIEEGRFYVDTMIAPSTAYAIPLTKEASPVIAQAYNDDGTHSHWRLVDEKTGKLLWTENPEEDKHIWVGEVPVTIISRKEDDLWDEADKEAMEYARSKCTVGDRAGKWLYEYHNYLRSTYKLTKLNK